MPTNAIQEVDLISIEQVQPSGIGKDVDFHGKLTQGFHPILSHPI